MTAVRYGTSFTVGALIALSLFLLMQELVWHGHSGDVGQHQRRTVLEFVRLRQESELFTKKRERPKREKPKEIEAPPPMDLQTSAPPDQQVVGIGAPDVAAALDLVHGGKPGGPGAAIDMDAIPLVRVNPQYPPRAQSAGIEGWVHVRFTVTDQGGTSDIEIVEAQPKGYFENAARKAVERYKYKPRLEDGKPVSRPGVELVLSFKLR